MKLKWKLAFSNLMTAEFQLISNHKDNTVKALNLKCSKFRLSWNSITSLSFAHSNFLNTTLLVMVVISCAQLFVAPLSVSLTSSLSSKSLQAKNTEVAIPFSRRSSQSGLNLGLLHYRWILTIWTIRKTPIKFTSALFLTQEKVCLFLILFNRKLYLYLLMIAYKDCIKY